MKKRTSLYSSNHHPDRRDFLLASAGLFGLAATSGCALRPLSAQQAGIRESNDPFTLGVASGDPLADGFVIWTRLAPQPLEGGGMPDAPVEVDWEVAADAQFRKIVAAGVAIAEPAWAHSVHVEIEGLAANRWYWYRFRAGAVQSPVGRTRTAPVAASTLDSLRFAFASCQHFEQGYFTAYRHMLTQQPELILHLGDYIYESSWGDSVRRHEAGEPHTLAEYRNRHARYKLDTDLQAAHAACPWLLTWDDHEVENDYSGTHNPHRDPQEVFLLRRAAAYQAYWEHQPLRLYARPQGPDMLLYQRSHFGDLVSIHMLDNRQYRSAQACPTKEKDGGHLLTTPCAELNDSRRSMLGPQQENWLRDGLSRSGARWNLIAQSMLMAPLDQLAGPGTGVWTDGWDGYPAGRARILAQLEQQKIANPVVIGGDIHSYWATELTADGGKAPVATEFVGTSITSAGVPYETFARFLPENPHIKYFESRERGYVMAHLQRDRLDVDFNIVNDVRDPHSGGRKLAGFTVESGQARVLKA